MMCENETSSREYREENIWLKPFDETLEEHWRGKKER